MSSIDDRLQRVRAFLHFQSLNPDKCHVSPEAEDAIAFAGEIERLREALRVERHEHHRRTQMTEYPSITANLLWNMDSVRRIDAALAYSASQNSLAAASQPKDVVCNCDDHDARYCVNRASRISPCRCGCHGASDTAAHSGEATTTGTQPTSLTNTDKSSG